MKKPFFPFSRLVIAGIGFASLFIAQPSLAQLNQVDAFPSGSTTDQNTDPFYRPNSGNLNMFDLMHRANFGSFNWNPDQKNQQLNSAAEQFKAEQNKRLQNQQQQGQVVPGLPAVTLPEATPQPQK
ncbi:hypothetical protein VB735_05030 [Halotia wernerae UHCC 0503]|nr:hypothetical protein [Halotia wernerae UHCC 0503]